MMGDNDLNPAVQGKVWRHGDVVPAPRLPSIHYYVSDALAAEGGGIGIAPGANLSDTVAMFEATHGTAPHPNMPARTTSTPAPSSCQPK